MNIYKCPKIGCYRMGKCWKCGYCEMHCGELRAKDEKKQPCPFPIRYD